MQQEANKPINSDMDFRGTWVVLIATLAKANRRYSLPVIVNVMRHLSHEV